MLKNPFFVYVATFGAVLLVYQLGWSEISPRLSRDLLLFFGLTFAAAIALGLLVSRAIRNTEDYRPGLLPKYSGVFVIATFLVEVALNGIPLVRIITGEKFFAIEAVATHLHLFSLWSVYSTIRFADYLYSKRLLYLLEALLPVIFYGLFVYRGPAMIVLLSWVFVFIIKQGGLKWKHAAIAASATILVFFVNGKIGDIRSPGDEKILGAPSASFKSSGIPSTFFWTYLYATVPIANLQLSVYTLTSRHGTIPEFIASELIPDTFSKRILPLLNKNITSGQGNLQTRDQLYSWNQPNIARGMNVSSIFGRSYGYFGWVGPVIMFTALSLFIVIYLFLISRSPYRVPSLALLNTLVAFCLFNNMLASAAMIPLLVWPLLLPPWRTLKKDTPPAAL
jgi:hypothetical protein